MTVRESVEAAIRDLQAALAGDRFPLEKECLAAFITFQVRGAELKFELEPKHFRYEKDREESWLK